MNMYSKELPVAVKSTLTKAELREKVAQAIERHDFKNLGGIDRIESLRGKDVDQLPIEGTVFAVIADELMSFGLPTDQTVGGVMEALGMKRGSTLAIEQTHEIGCSCHGEFISPLIAGERIRNLNTILRS